MRYISMLALSLAAGAAFAQSSAKPVAVVNGEPITRAELDAVMNMRPRSVTPLSASQERSIVEQIVNVLIDEKLLRQFLAKNVGPADPVEVDKQLAALQTALKAQNRTLDDYCREMRQTNAQIRQSLDTMVRWNAYFAKKGADAELKSYFQENKDFFDRVTVQCSHIVYRIAADSAPAEKADAAKKMQELRDQIVAGKLTFADAAKKFSHCPSATRGGSLGYIHRKWMVEEPFAKVAFALKVNEMSNVVTTDFGVHLILVTDRKPPELSDFNKVKDEVRECMSEEMRQKVILDSRKVAKIDFNLP